MINPFTKLKDKFSPKSPSTEKKQILIVDDDEKICFILKKILESNPDYEIVGEAHDGNEALELYKLTKPDAIILDIKLPEMDGPTAMKHILEINPNAKIIALSALADRKTIVETIKAGASNYITKPVGVDQLLEVLNETFYGFDADTNKSTI